jgi:hypothetical protein
MTPEQRKARADRFRLWLEQDGLGETLDGLKAAYVGRIAELDQTDRDFASRARILASAAKVVDVVRDHLVAAMAEGVVAADEIRRMERMSSLSAEARRWI